MPSNKPDPDELIVKTQYFISGETDQANLKKIQEEIIRVLQMEGYRQTDIDPLPIGPIQHTMDFRLFDGIPVEDQESLTEKAKSLFGSSGNTREVQGISTDEFLEGLKKARDDLPFRLVFHFKPYDEGDVEGYDIEIESIPVLLQKYRQLPVREDYSYNKKDIVSQNRREVTRIMGRMGLEPLREPYTEAETLKTQLKQEYRRHLDSVEYGSNVLQYLDEGDTCFQRDLYHAALNCYIHALEWTIITYLNEERGKDVIEEQKENEDTRYYFHHFVDLIQGDSPIKQTTMESLQQYKDTERHWIAHHRSGDLPETRVEDVRETLLNLIGELFTLRDQ
jgi:hypothetical protein